MKQYLKYVITIALISAAMLEMVLITIIKCNPGTFYDSYQSIIVDKYRILQKTDEPKIIIVAGSSSAFGLDQGMLENETGYKIANLGLHAGFGPLFYTELAKENINSGDIVLLGYEYGWHGNFDYLGQQLIMSGIDNNIDLYKHIPIRKWADFIGYIFSYASMKNSYEGSNGNYSREAFDSQTAQMTFERNYTMDDYAENVKMYGKCDITDFVLEEDTIENLNRLKKYVEDKGASIYFVSPPILDEAIVCDYSEFYRLKDLEEEKIGIAYISDPLDYFYSKELMSNAIYHCNSEGEKVRTKQLIEDMKNAKILK